MSAETRKRHTHIDTGTHVLRLRRRWSRRRALSRDSLGGGEARGGGGGGGGGGGRVRQSRPEGGSKEKEYQGPRETETDIDRGSWGGGMWGGDWCCSRVGTTRGGSGWPRRRRRRRRLSWTKSILWPPIPRHPFASFLQPPPSTPLRPNPPGSPPKVAE
ncbi:hypothetical protein K0M31_019099 [Melipona bicolor]|uniref:Uncharacterized protein n=1 Tax=Melipona bicolor TaxID=60889 RepID=A0AA40G2M7_9HYME|nr:hypothetical protein K0M31_019099 [Melipona bicolor]